MTPFLAGVVCGVAGLLLGMWIRKHPEDARTASEAIMDRIRKLRQHV